MHTGRQDADYRLWEPFDPAGRTHFRYTIVDEDYYSPGVQCAGRTLPGSWTRGFDQDGHSEIRAAFNAWAEVSGVTFEEVPWDPRGAIEAVEIVIGMDYDDGRGGTVAATGLVEDISNRCGWGWTLEGNETVIVFDSADYGWDFGSSGYGRATQAERNGFYNTALHEIGHAIGIDHSDQTGKVLSGLPTTPYTNYGGARATLTGDDIAAAVALYGPRHGAGTDTEQPTYTNTIIGTPGFDRLYGTDGNDVLTGGAGRDLLAGGPGNDLLLGGFQGATLFGQGGADRFVFTGGRNWFMDFDPTEGDRIAGITAEYFNTLVGQGQAGVQQVNAHFAMYLGTTPWGDDANVIWLADTTPAAGYPGADWFLA